MGPCVLLVIMDRKLVIEAAAAVADWRTQAGEQPDV